MSKHASYTTVVGEIICNKTSSTALNLFYLMFLVLMVPGPYYGSIF